MDLDLATVDKLLSTTRSVRKRLDLTRPVPTEIIADCIGLATQAPSAANLQLWRWVVVTDEATRKAIAVAHRAATEEYMRGVLATTADSAERRRFESALHLVEHLHEVPVHVLLYALEPAMDGGFPPAALYGSVFPAAWSFQLALRARGLGTSQLLVQDERAVRDAVGAPEHARTVALFPVAYFTGESFKPAARLPIEDVLCWDRWSFDQ